MHELFYREVIDCMSDGVYCVDMNRSIIFWNKAAQRITGYSSDEIIGKCCADNFLCHVDATGKELCIHGCPLASAMCDNTLRQASVFLHHKNGHRVPVLVKAMPLRHANGEVYGAVETFSVITGPATIVEQLEKYKSEALKDPLTGVGNRRFAESTLERLGAMLRKDGLPYGVIFADIDHFKQINDTWGHGVGDMVLKMVAKSLAGGLRMPDAVCRWGGEEFLMVLPGVDEADLLRVCERLRTLVKKSWFEHGCEQISVNVSFGGTVARQGEPFEQVVERADEAMYYCKEHGRDCIHIS